MGLGKTNKHEKGMDWESKYTGKQLYGENKYAGETNVFAKQIHRSKYIGETNTWENKYI